MAGVRHQHAIAAGQRQIGGQRRALVAALFLDDLDEEHLAALDDILDLVAATKVLPLLAKLVGSGLVDRRAVGLGAGGDRMIIIVAMLVGVGRMLVVVIGILAALGSLVLIVVLGSAQPLFLGGVLGLFTKQCFPVRLRDLIIIGVDFAEGEEAVAVATIVDERRLQRRFDPRDFC